MRIKRAAMVFMVAGWGLATCATTYYADNKVGNDANDGLSAEKAFRTLAAATARLKPGDVLEISPGRIYYESLNIVTSGTPEKPVGLVYACISDGEKHRLFKFNLGGDREQIRYTAAKYFMREFLLRLMHRSDESEDEE